MGSQPVTKPSWDLPYVRVMCIIKFAHILSLWDNFQSAALPTLESKFVSFMWKMSKLFQVIQLSIFSWLFESNSDRRFTSVTIKFFVFYTPGMKISFQYWICRNRNKLKFLCYDSRHFGSCCLTVVQEIKRPHSYSNSCKKI